MKDIAVILINYNSSTYTLKCIEALEEFTSEAISYQIIVVDNNSELSDYKILKQNFPKKENIELYRSDLNTGFGGGNMLGAQYANAKYLLFLNNDAMLLNDCLSILYHYMESNQTVGVCTAQNYDQYNHLLPSFDHNKGLRRLLFGRSFLEKMNPERFPKHKKKYTQPLKADWVGGAFLFFNAKAFKECGGFDTAIFLFWEEMDICYRLKKLGYSSVLVPEAKILHYQGSSIGSSPVIDKEAYISYVYVIRKNFGFIKYVTIRKYLVFAILLKPKKWYLLSVLLKLNPSKASLKHKQTPRIFDENRNI